MTRYPSELQLATPDLVESSKMVKAVARRKRAEGSAPKLSLALK